ncbi:Fe-S-cluster oxidoreductase [Neptuniibacter sp. QD72_48]|uniref:Fe-S-cluster oxidoreductase n=1 Tax=unclassified Neptuniibacter TaxID=2630693 RepID=UPI0039F714FE
MQCRENCGACCIAPSITSLNKPAGERCKHLDQQNRCEIFGTDQRPKACANFAPEEEFCGQNREEALQILTLLESSTH